MAKILIWAELNDNRVKSVTYEMLSHLSGHTRHVLLIGGNGCASEALLQTLKEAGVDLISIVEHDALALYSPESYSRLVAEIVSAETPSYDVILAGATSQGKDLWPRVAARLGLGMASDCVSFRIEDNHWVGTRPLYAGKCMALVEAAQGHSLLATIRPNALGLGAVTSGEGIVKRVPFSPTDTRAIIRDIVKAASGKLDLTEATIIISGGRGMKSAENFKLLRECADILGATVGASRAAVDAGYADHAMQVGQTGKTVSPTLYIACGISGAIQHMAGMRTSKFIVAVNTDPDAPIFSIADYGIVGDLFTVVPLLTNEFRSVVKG